MFLIVLEWAIAAVLLLLFLTQIFFPLWRNTPTFPLFRRERKLEAEMEKVRQKGLEASLERDLRKLKMGQVYHGEPPGKVSKLPGVEKDR